MKAEEVETESTVVGFKGMADVGLVGMEFQAQGCQPICRHLAQVLQRSQVGMQDDEVVGIADERGGRLGRAGLTDGGLEAVQRDVGEERREG